MSFSAESIQEKPYNMCLNCVHIGKNCDGPNFLSMDIGRLSEWCRLRKDYLHNIDTKWTNEYIAEQSGLSKAIIDKFLSGRSVDMKISTLSSLLQVLVSGSNGLWGQYPCAMGDYAETKIEYIDNPVLVAKADSLEQECERLRTDLKIMQEEYRLDLEILDQRERDRTIDLRNQVKFQEQQLLAKDKLLDERADYLRRKDRWISRISTILGVCIFIMIAALVVDALNRDIGFFWVDRISGIFNKGNSFNDWLSLVANVITKK